MLTRKYVTVLVLASTVVRAQVPDGSATNNPTAASAYSSIKLIRARANYSFTPWMFVSGLFQYNSSNDSLSMNLRLRWEYFRGSELFVVYTDDRDTFGARFAALKNRALVVKINRLLRF